MTPTTSAHTAAPRLAGTHVLHGRELRSGVRLADTARFEDDEWPLAPAALQGQERGLTLRFAIVPPAYQRTLKTLSYVALSGPLPPDEPRPTISTVVSVFYNIGVFLRWLDDHHGGRAVSLVSAETLLEFQRFLLTEYRTGTRRHALRAAVAFLWRYRHGLGAEALRIDPRTIPGWKEQHNPRTENTTARIPEDVHARVLVWALRFVNDFADDILRAVARWEQLRVSGPRRHSPRGSNLINITRYLDDAHQAGRPLPGFNGQVNYAAIARSIGCNRRALDDHNDAIAEAVATLGVSDFAYLGVPIQGRLDGEPWIGGVSLDPIRDDSLTVLTQMLQAACYIVVAFLSGMRDSEVKHLRRGCCATEKDGNGNPYRWRVTSLAFKGEGTPSGVPATWVVGQSAATAISVLERIHQDRARDRTDWLFAPIKSGPGAGSAGRGGNIAMTVAGTNRQLNRFVTWVNDYCRTHDRGDGIPDVDGRPWRLSTRQFRRTLAWYIARRPGGSIAGAIAYRHHSVQMFEGYAGTTESGFRAEVEAEQALSRGEHLLAMIDHNEHTRLTGPAADEAQRRMEEMSQRPAFAGTVTTDRRRFLRLISLHGPAVYPGKYVTCVYTHSKALCRAGAEQPADAPDQAHCKPLTCRNVALTEQNVHAWHDELDTLDRDLASGPPLPPALTSRLEQRREQILAFLHRHQEQQ